MNNPIRRLHLSGPGLVLAMLVLLLFTSLALADEYRPSGASELIDAIEEINRLGEPAVLILEGSYVFTELDSDESLVLPEVTALGVAIVAKDSAEFVWNGSATDSPTLWRSSEFAIPLGEAVFIWLQGGGINTDALPRKRRPSSTRESLGNDPGGASLVSGFETVFDIRIGNLAVHGLRAECEEQCIRVQNSPVAVVQSTLECGDDCIRAEDVEPRDAMPAWNRLREELEVAALEGFNRAEVLGWFDRAVGLTTEGEVVIDSTRAQTFDSALAVTGTQAQRVVVRDSFLGTRSTGSRAVDLQSSARDNWIVNTVISAPVSRSDALDFTYGGLRIENSFIDAGEQGMAVTDGTITLRGVSVALNANSFDQACDTTFSSDEFLSEGGNVIADDSCALTGPGDVQSTDPGLFFADEADSIPMLPDGAPELDRVQAQASASALPCSATDITGLPRPQDADGDGLAECDTGPVERQAGGDIGAPQSGAFYSAERNGEGIFVEMLPGDLAVVYLFSYRPDGSPFWALGLGSVNRNGIVIPRADFLTTRGGLFGEDFDPAAVEYLPFADFAVSLPGCSGGSGAGMLAIEPNAALGFEPLLGRMTQLTRIMGCDQVQFGAGYSGSFFDPTHNGEGIIVQVVDPGTAVIIWFSYDPEGNQYWMLGTGTIDGNTITVSEAVAQTGPRYGTGYDPDDVVQIPWGSFTATYSEDCNGVDFSYSSLLPAFGSGTQDMQRLTSLDGIRCAP